MLLGQKVILVTGASQGIGEAIALECAQERATVVVNYLKSHRKAKQVVERINSQGGSALAVQADVRDRQQLRRLKAEIHRKFKRLDGIVNNAGVSHPKSFATLSDDDWDEDLNTNLLGPFRVIQELVELFSSKGGSIVNIASVRGIQPRPGSIAYSASKAGLISLTQALATELGPRIRVNALAPGYVNTSWHRSVDPTWMKDELAMTALKRIGEPSEIARIAVFLLSNQSSYVTGHTLVADGGYLLGQRRTDSRGRS